MTPASSPLATILSAVGRQMRAEFEKSAVIQHSPSKGTAREVLILERYLRQYLPGNFLVSGSSEIIAANGARSGQCDIVVYDASAPPLYDEFSYRILPAECVYAVIEIKSKLDSRELKASTENIARVKRLPKTAYFNETLTRVRNQYGKQYKYCPTAGFIFAFDSIDLGAIANTLERIVSAQQLEERIDAAWLLGKGCLNWMNPDQTILPHPHPGAWLSAGQVPPDQDVLLNMTMILNSHLAHAFMPPFRFMDYAATATMLSNVNAWNVDKT